MQNPYVQASLGIILIGLSVLIAAFLIAVGVVAISTAKSVAARERMKRKLMLKMTESGRQLDEDGLK